MLLKFAGICVVNPDDLHLEWRVDPVGFSLILLSRLFDRFSCFRGACGLQLLGT